MWLHDHLHTALLALFHELSCDRMVTEFTPLLQPNWAQLVLRGMLSASAFQKILTSVVDVLEGDITKRISWDHTAC